MSRRALIAVAVLLALQAAAVAIYFRVQRGRSTKAAPFAVERLSGDDTAPALELDRADGSPLDLRVLTGKARLVHFWATWCPPCREELPGLLAFARSGQIELLAVSVDQDWENIRRFFPGGIPPEVTKSRDRTVHTRYGVTTLPDTYLVSPSGRLVLRFGSARDWRSAAARRALREEVQKWR